MIENRKNYGNNLKELLKDKKFRDKFVKNVKDKINTPEAKLKLKESLNKLYKTQNGSFYGRHHTQESKDKMKRTLADIKHQQGENNAHYGKMWIYSLTEKRSTRINSSDEIPEGWLKGRKMKFS